MGAGGQITYLWRFLTAVYREYMRDDCRLMAAAISFYALLSLVPLLLVGLSTFGYVLGNDRAFDAVYAFLIQLLPQDLAATLLPEEVAGAGLRSYLKKTLVKPAGVAGIVGVVSWMWAGTNCFVVITAALDVAWESGKRRGFIASRLVAVGMMMLVATLALLSFGMTQALKIIREYPIPWLGIRPEEIPFLWQLVGWAVPLTLSILVFVLCYLILPDRRIGWRPALTGGVVAGMLWELAKQGFAFYVANFVDYNSIYGSLGGLVILVMWVYLSAVMLLLGAEVASVSADWSAKSVQSPAAEDR